jgi:hypothetical protein
MATVLSTNMSLPVPVVGQEAGPQYAIDLNACLALLDQHDHTSGNGVKITPLGMSITSDLAFGSNNATALRTLRFTNQSATLGTASDLGCLYETNGNLYYNDSSGNQIQMTLAGAVNTSGSGNITGMGATTASVNYVSASKTFTFLSNTGVPGALNFGPLYLSPAASNTFNIAVTAPALAASYTLTLPATAPASTKIMTMDSTGATAVAYDTDNSTLEVSSNTLRVKDLGVTTAKLANNAVTQAKRAALGQQVSSSSGTFSTTSNSYVDVTNLTVTLTTTGRPIYLALIPGDVSNAARLIYANNAFLQFLEDGVQIGGELEFTVVSSTVRNGATPSTIALSSAGTHTYKVQVHTTGASSLSVTGYKLIAYEL